MKTVSSYMDSLFMFLFLAHDGNAEGNVTLFRFGMNEWSPGGTYRPVTPNQQNQMRSFRSHWDDQNTEKSSAKPLVVNIRAVADSRSRATFQQRSQEDLSKTSLSTSNRIKKTVNGSSDPRFKRVIPPGAQSHACVGTEVKLSKPSSTKEVNEQEVKNNKDWDVIDKKSKHQWGENTQNNKDSMKNQFCEGNIVHKNANVTAQEPVTFSSVKEPSKDNDKYSNNHEPVANAHAKQSLSDCTVNTRNTSLVSEDLADEFVDRLHAFSSTTRVKKVQNWIADQKPKVDKRQSVITVIGQTQGQSPLSSALHEIDQRRKLVKELDKFAICNKITDSDKDKEMNTLVAQINFLSPSGKLLYSSDKKYELKDFPCRLRPGSMKYQDGAEKISKNLGSTYDDSAQCDNEMSTEHETSLSPSSEDTVNHMQKKSYCCYKWEDKYDIKGKIRRVVSRIPYPWLAYFMIFLSGTLCWYTYMAFHRNGYFVFEIFPQKPKTTTLYEKICYWIWELFRPSGNYHRSSSWSR